MITCEICGSVFREENNKEFARHNSVAHLHDWKRIGNYGRYPCGFGYVIYTTEEILERDKLLERKGT